MTTPQKILSLCREQDVKVVDVRFVDFPGKWQGFTIPVTRLDEEAFESGLGFDGTGFRGWRAFSDNDMVAVPQPDTAFLDPCSDVPTLCLIANIHDPLTGDDYLLDPRNVAWKAANYLKTTTIADTASFGPQVEFFLFDKVRSKYGLQSADHAIDREPGEWDPARRSALVADPDAALQGTQDRSTGDPTIELRNELMRTMFACGLLVESQHHAAREQGQVAIELRSQELVPIADAVMRCKHLVKNISGRHGRNATFMPKPVLGRRGNGMHTQLSLWKDGIPLFAGNGYAGLSDLALHAVGGILKHAASITAFTNPTTNSYRRLVPEFEAPVELTYSRGHRSSACRIPVYRHNPQDQPIEFRCPDPSCNPYLAFSALLMAAIDGVQNKISPGDPVAEAPLSSTDRPTVPSPPISLAAALNALQDDHDFLLRGDVFTPEILHAWTRMKREDEVEALRRRPHPYEFSLYFDA